MTKARRDDKHPAPPAVSTWGGRREGAGRKPTGVYGFDRRGRPRSGISHRRRDIDGRHPVHVTLRAVAGAPDLRRAAVAAEVGKLLERRAGREPACRVARVAIRRDHIHVIVEAADRTAVARGIQGLASGLARVINRMTGGSGKLWLDRYDARPLRTPREMRACVTAFFPKR